MGLKEYLRYRQSKKLLRKLDSLPHWDVKLIEDVRGRRLEIKYLFSIPKPGAIAELFEILMKYEVKMEVVTVYVK